MKKILSKLYFSLLLLTLPWIASSQNQPTQKAALSVQTLQPKMQTITRTLTANGALNAWQEAVIGSQVSGLQLQEINAQVGDHVKKGQVLAVFDTQSLQVEIAQHKANLAQAQAQAYEAQLNFDRVKQVEHAGAFSAQQIDQLQANAQISQAKVDVVKAQFAQAQLSLKHAQVLAIDDGVITAQNATLGEVAAQGQALFRMIRKERLEWQGEVSSDELLKLKTGMRVTVSVGEIKKTGTIRMLAPTLSTQNRNALIYVDLPDAYSSGLRAGMFARGEIALEKISAITVPFSVISLRDGFSYVYKLGQNNGDLSNVVQIKVSLGERIGDDIEILSGVSLQDSLVASGSAFLSDGDWVRVLNP
jgi:RND family efflux transporter MFP subunit